MKIFLKELSLSLSIAKSSLTSPSLAKMSSDWAHPSNFPLIGQNALITVSLAKISCLYDLSIWPYSTVDNSTMPKLKSQAKNLKVDEICTRLRSVCLLIETAVKIMWPPDGSATSAACSKATTTESNKPEMKVSIFAIFFQINEFFLHVLLFPIKIIMSEHLIIQKLKINVSISRHTPRPCVRKPATSYFPRMLCSFT